MQAKTFAAAACWPPWVWNASAFSSRERKLRPVAMKRMRPMCSSILMALAMALLLVRRIGRPGAAVVLARTRARTVS
uniref:Uncharacterized protein n=1 Tax=Leifsonia xyli subsp. cynodontis TaxID=31966 RepID=Q6EEG3_LEIXC|nr:unknown [Leifsonia xyli subsp. cynodontis]